VLLFIMLVCYLFLHRKQVTLSGCFLDVASDCLQQNLKAVLHLLLFTALTVLFIVLLIFEYLSFSSASPPTPNGLYYTSHCSGFLLFLLAVQAVWGFSFLRDASTLTITQTTTWFLESPTNGTSTSCTCSATLSNDSSPKIWAASPGDPSSAASSTFPH
jgi:hypothetical protein